MTTWKNMSFFILANFISITLLTAPIEQTNKHKFLYLKNEGRSVFHALTMTGLTPKYLSLDIIQEEIMQHVIRRQVDNFFFINVMIHTATLQAIKAYLNLDDEKQEAYHNIMQTILDSHASFLFHPFYWRKAKHVRLVDNFVYLCKGKRFELSPLDSIITSFYFLCF